MGIEGRFMNWHEYQSKQLFAQYAIPIPKGQVAGPPAEAVAAASEAGRPAVGGKSPQPSQRADELLIVTPSLHGIVVNPLSHLPITGSRHWTLGLVEVQAPLIPFETEEIQDLARPTFLICNQPLVRHIQNRFRRQYRAPVRK